MLINFYKIIYIILITQLLYGYIGPGMGGGLIAVTLGILIAIFGLIFGILWFPFKKYILKTKKKNKQI